MRYRVRNLQPPLVDGCSHLPSNAGDCLLFMEEEIWRPILKSGGKYEVSNFGEVRNFYTKRVIRQTKTRSYCYVSMWYGNKRVRKAVHRLVAEAFISNPKCLPQINHKDENPSNNNSKNLEWCTASYNAKYGNRNKKMLETRTEKDRKTRKRPVYGVKDGRKTYFDSILSASRKTGIDFSNISKCCRSNCYNKSAGGFRWEYAD